MLNNLKVLRESNGYTQQQVADKIGVTQQAIQKYETQKNEPDINTLKMLADVFEVSVDYLIDHRALGQDPNYAISKDEYTVIEYYRKLDTQSRGAILHIMKKLSSGK